VVVVRVPEQIENDENQEAYGELQSFLVKARRLAVAEELP
jgi:hypothetical protein